jgi:hypothetical protein
MATDGASSARALGQQEVEASIPTPPKRSRGNVAKFTRFPEEHAGIKLLELRACERWILELFYTWADADGCNWNGISEIQAAIPRSGKRPKYARVSLRVALRDLRKKGLIDWQRVLPQHRYPRSGDAARPSREYNGIKTEVGGRVWRLRREEIRASIAARRAELEAAAEARRAARRRRLAQGPAASGTGRAGWIISEGASCESEGSCMIDPGSIIHDPSSDSVLPTEELKKIPAAPDAPQTPPAPPSHEAACAPLRPAASPRPSAAAPPPENEGAALRAAAPPARPVLALAPCSTSPPRASPPAPAPTRESSTKEREQTAHHARPQRSHTTLVHPIDPGLSQRALDALLAPDRGRS